jgi:peptidoglycan/LPS O-acetylase OafA/YrhL
MRLVWNGSHGVDIFFAMSGFLIGHMLIQEYEQRGKIAIGHFYLRRALRLFPAYYLSLGILYFLNINDPSTVWANLLYVNNFISWERQYMQWAWSLAIEEQFYIVFPVLLASLYQLRRCRLTILVSLLALAFVIRYLVYVYQVPGFSYMDTVYVKPYTRYGAILCGVIAAYLAAYSHLIQTIATKPRLISSSLIMSGLGIVIMSFEKNIIFTEHVNGSLWFLLYISSYHYVLAAGITWIIIVTIKPIGFAQIVSRFLSWKPWYPIAQLSYSTYLVHPMVIILLYRFWCPNTPLLVWITIPISCVLSLGASVFVYLFIERPFMDMRPARWSARRDCSEGPPSGSDRDLLQVGVGPSAQG